MPYAIGTTRAFRSDLMGPVKFKRPLAAHIPRPDEIKRRFGFLLSTSVEGGADTAEHGGGAAGKRTTAPCLASDLK